MGILYTNAPFIDPKMSTYVCRGCLASMRGLQYPEMVDLKVIIMWSIEKRFLGMNKNIFKNINIKFLYIQLDSRKYNHREHYVFFCFFYITGTYS